MRETAHASTTAATVRKPKTKKGYSTSILRLYAGVARRQRLRTMYARDSAAPKSTEEERTKVRVVEIVATAITMIIDSPKGLEGMNRGKEQSGGPRRVVTTAEIKEEEMTGTRATDGRKKKETEAGPGLHAEQGPNDGEGASS